MDNHIEAEIIQLVRNVRNLDCDRSFSVLRDYLNHYMKGFGRTYKIPGCDSDEIEQECLVALRDKAIKDFNPSRGKFKNFAVLCIKRHLCSLIKSNNQQKRRVLNQSLSLDEDRSSSGDEYLSLANMVQQDGLSVDEELSKNETYENKKRKLLSKCSVLEQHVLILYLEQKKYDEIVEELNKIFPKRKCSIKSIDNSLQRIRFKAQTLLKNQDFEP